MGLIDAIRLKQALAVSAILEDKKTIEQIIDEQPTIEPERKTGRWIRNDNGTYSCSVCQAWIPEEQHYYARYCLHCGADMRGEQDDSISD